MPSLIPKGPWARRLVYELVYAWPGSRHMTTFNVGLAPVAPDVLADPAYAHEASQIQLYAELFAMAGLETDEWRQAAVVEVAAGCGGGLRYLTRRFGPRQVVGIDLSAAAAWRGRRLGLDMRQGEATRLPFDDGHFDCFVCVDALNYFDEQDFMREARRVLKPSGRVMLAETSPDFAFAKARFGRMARSEGLTVDAVRDVSQEARRSIRERSHRVAKALAWTPPFLRDRVREMVMAEGSDQYRRWQEGEICFAMAVLSRTSPRDRSISRRESACLAGPRGGSLQERAG